MKTPGMSFHSSRSSVLLLFFSFNIAPPQFWSSYLSVPTHSHLPCFHYYIVFLFICPNLSVASLIVSLMFPTPALALISPVLIFSILFIPIIHVNILIAVLSSKSHSAFFSVSLPYISTGLSTVTNTWVLLRCS